MRVGLALLVIGLAVSSQGCALVADGTHLVSYEITQSISECRERARNRRWAKAAWDEECRLAPTHPFSGDFAHGFKKGFEDFLYRGEAEPPPMAPARYRTLRYQTREGYQAIEDWFNGYRRGVAVAQQKGYRQWVTGPSALQHLYPGPMPPPPIAHEPVPVPAAKEVLPSPKKAAPQPRNVKHPEPSRETVSLHEEGSIPLSHEAPLPTCEEKKTPEPRTSATVDVFDTGTRRRSFKRAWNDDEISALLLGPVPEEEEEEELPPPKTVRPVGGTRLPLAVGEEEELPPANKVRPEPASAKHPDRGDEFIILHEEP